MQKITSFFLFIFSASFRMPFIGGAVSHRTTPAEYGAVGHRTSYKASRKVQKLFFAYHLTN